MGLQHDQQYAKEVLMSFFCWLFGMHQVYESLRSKILDKPNLAIWEFDWPWMVEI
jgi:hypothetical protein